MDDTENVALARNSPVFMEFVGQAHTLATAVEIRV